MSYDNHNKQSSGVQTPGIKGSKNAFSISEEPAIKADNQVLQVQHRYGGNE